MTLHVFPMAWCRRCEGDRPHRPLTFGRVLVCNACGRWRHRP